jgi:uncharacterized protein (DUF952 family)
VIYLVMPTSDWESHDGDMLARPGEGGFVHCCDEGQIEQVRRDYFPADQDVVALALDPTQLTAETRYEPGSGGEPQRFPHVYGAVARASVLDARRC